LLCHTIWYGVELLLVLLSRFCQSPYPKISFQHHAFFFFINLPLGADGQKLSLCFVPFIKMEW